MNSRIDGYLKIFPKVEHSSDPEGSFHRIFSSEVFDIVIVKSPNILSDVRGSLYTGVRKVKTVAYSLYVTG